MGPIKLERRSGETDLAPRPKNDLRPGELLPLIEFGCWTAILLFPLLYYVNGPSVSIDQTVVRTILIFMTIIGAIVLRICNWHRNR